MAGIAVEQSPGFATIAVSHVLHPSTPLIGGGVKPPLGRWADTMSFLLEEVMAFNPFSSFWKYKNAWMAGVLLLTMITFVLCTGTNADLSQRIIDYFRGRGTAYL